MALNPDYVGHEYPPSEPYVVGREKVREFAASFGDRNPACHDVAAAQALGYADVVAPPTFAFAVTNAAMSTAMFDPGLGLNYAMVVHGEQRFQYARPIVAGDVLVVRPVIEGIRSVAGNDLLTFRGDVTTEGGEPVVSTWSVIVSRGTAQEG